MNDSVVIHPDSLGKSFIHGSNQPNDGFNYPSKPTSFVNAYLDYKDIVLVTRDCDNEILTIRKPVEYSCFVKTSDIDSELERELVTSRYIIGLTHDSKQEWTKICFIDRWKCNDVCKYLDFKNIQTYEGNIHPVLRCMVDNKFGIVRPKVAYIDLETDSRIPFSLKEDMRILCWAVVDEEGNEFYDSLIADTDKRECDLLKSLYATLDPYDLILAWNGDGFDFPVLKARNERVCTGVNIKRWLWLDQMELFIKSNAMAAKSGAEKVSYRLNDVAQELVGYGKIGLDASKTWEYWKAGKDERTKLVEYNVRDTRLMYEIEKKTGYIDLLITVCAVCGVFPDSRGMKKTTQAEGYMLRLGSNINHKFKTFFKLEETTQYKGAFVMQPTKTGINKDVHVADFSTMYPSIITTWNMSAETVTTDKDSALSPLTGIRFKHEPEGILPKAISEMVRLRKQWSDLQKKEPPGTDKWIDYERRSTASKITANSFYGVTGTIYSWLFDRDVAESVTQCGSWLIKETIKAAENRGMEVIYGDTDSIFVIGCGKSVFEGFIKECNTEIYPRLLSEIGCKNNHIQLGYEKQFDRIIFTAAKKYIGKYRHYKGKQASSDSRPEIKGVEYKRGDTISLARELLKEIIYKLVGSEPSEDPIDFTKIMKKWFKRITENDLKLEDVVLSKRLSKNLKEYSRTKNKKGGWNKQPPHVEIARLLQERGDDVNSGASGAKIDYVVIGKDNGVKAVSAKDWDGIIDRYNLWNNYVAPPTIRLLTAAFPEKKWNIWSKIKNEPYGTLRLPYVDF